MCAYAYVHRQVNVLFLFLKYIAPTFHERAVTVKYIYKYIVSYIYIYYIICTK
jgi:hypothetical protein